MKKFLFFIFWLVNFQSVYSAPLTESELDSYRCPRGDKQWGFYLSGLGDPVVSLVGVNAAYNINERFRANLGIGGLWALFDIGYSVGGGIKYFFIADRRIFSPVLGVNISLTHYNTDNLNSVFNNIFSSASSIGSVNFLNATANLGLDFQLKSGFNLGFGANVGLMANNFAFLPYLNLGWFF